MEIFTANHKSIPIYNYYWWWLAFHIFQHKINIYTLYTIRSIIRYVLISICSFWHFFEQGWFHFLCSTRRGVNHSKWNFRLCSSYIEKKWGNNSGNNNNSALNNNSSNATGGAGAYTGVSSAFRTSSTSGSSAGVGGPSYNSQYNNSSSTYSYQYNIGQPSYSTNVGQNDRKYGTANNQVTHFLHQSISPLPNLQHTTVNLRFHRDR